QQVLHLPACHISVPASSITGRTRSPDHLRSRLRGLLWALAAGGRAGAETALALLATELRDALTLAGCADPAAARDLRTLTGG
ncbi:alpha-hydroxy-acid oxidizing protein, partial [Micromonospora purpureochromogenes]|uniref:alpha-hydroxy-acid oxidizing protein n=1 Tax=Micromonospora purpureochromogenes TaxID=47872 RepID=UPI003317C9E2